MSLSFNLGTLEQLGPGHYKVVHKKEYWTGRRPGPVPKDEQKSDRIYCTCDRLLNRNNRTGICSTCLRGEERHSAHLLKRG